MIDETVPSALSSQFVLSTLSGKISWIASASAGMPDCAANARYGMAWMKRLVTLPIPVNCRPMVGLGPSEASAMPILVRDQY